MRNPKKLVFIHIPKTAGTSLRLLIESNYEPHERKSIYTYENLDNELAAALEDPKIKCIFGHFPLRPVIAQSDAMVVTMFREPIARSISHYNHYKRRLNDHHKRLMQDIHSPHDFPKIVESNNRHTAFLSGYLNQRKFLEDPNVLERALESFDRLDAVGFTEEYAASIAYFGSLFNWRNTYVEHHNSGSKKDDGNLELWKSLNDKDLIVYEKAWERFGPVLEPYKKMKLPIHRIPLWTRIKGYLRALSSKFWPR